MTFSVAQVALPVFINKTFDYLVGDHRHLNIGMRVCVPFRNRQLIGIVTDLHKISALNTQKLKAIESVLDTEPLWSEPLFQLLIWSSQYYHHPLGEVFAQAMPSFLRQGKPACVMPSKYWFITQAGQNALMTEKIKGTKQKHLLECLSQGERSHQELLKIGISSTVLNNLVAKTWIASELKTPTSTAWYQAFDETKITASAFTLNQEQAIAIASINAKSDEFSCSLIDGVTGSGKTEVYLDIIAASLLKKRQALVLIPEIGLTPQTLQRFKDKFNVPIAVIHSGLSDKERFEAWLKARNEEVAIVIGTRSALFTPFANLGVIIIDEEHDSSFKQNDSFRYHARDIAIMRAAKKRIPIVLGSATPSLETLRNAKEKKYQHFILSKRGGNAQFASQEIIDIRGQQLSAGLSTHLINKIQAHLTSGGQVLIFINRRGYAPVIMCHECGWVSHCQRCDAKLTFHVKSRQLKCHHCAYSQPVAHQCPSCGSVQIISLGQGTEQVEQKLAELFPDFKTIRIDRDTMNGKESFDKALAKVQAKEYQILIGTQMLAKGHHFPDVSLAAIIDLDSALYSSDFRASERLAQLFVQVAGRAGRASRQGTVVLQTHHPEHSLLKTLVYQNYSNFATDLLTERTHGFLPPFTHLALLRAEAYQPDEAVAFLQQAKQIFAHFQHDKRQAMLLGPSPSTMEKRGGRYRWQLWLQAGDRKSLHQWLTQGLAELSVLKGHPKVRWSIDVDPQDTF